MERLTKVDFTNLDKFIFPELKITKGQMIEYYVRAAPKILHILKDRPLSLKRFPDGVDKGGFFEKDAPMGTPPWVRTFRRYSVTAKRDVNYVVCDDLDTLAWMANMATIEIHMPLSRVPNIEVPDFALFDIDPEPPFAFDDTVGVTLLLKERIDALGLESYIKTSGKKGLHVLIPVAGGYTFKQTRDFVHRIGVELSKESEAIVSELPQSQEPGTVFIDYLQNSHGRTIVSPYSLRATKEATVSMPIPWSMVKKGLRPDQFTISTVPKMGDPWEDLLENRQRLELR